MKKLLYVLLGFCVLLTFSACKDTQAENKIDYKSIKIETVNDFYLETVTSDSVEKRFICELDTGEWEGTINDYDLYYYGLDEVNIIVGDKTISLKDALDNGVLSVQLLLDKLETDADIGKCSEDMYKEGGTLRYEYDEYTVFKFKVINGPKDIYIGIPDMQYDVKEK